MTAHSTPNDASTGVIYFSELDAKESDPYRSPEDVQQGKYTRIQNERIVLVSARSPNYTGYETLVLFFFTLNYFMVGVLRVHYRAVEEPLSAKAI
jgi:hypothetical protein